MNRDCNQTKAKKKLNKRYFDTLQIESGTLPTILSLLRPTTRIKLITKSFSLLLEILHHSLDGLDRIVESSTTFLGEILESLLSRDDILALSTESGELAGEELLVDADRENRISVRADLRESGSVLLNFHIRGSTRERGERNSDESLEVRSEIGGAGRSSNRSLLDFEKLSVERFESCRDRFLQCFDKLRLYVAAESGLGEEVSDGVLRVVDRNVESLEIDFDVREREERLLILLGSILDYRYESATNSKKE